MKRICMFALVLTIMVYSFNAVAQQDSSDVFGTFKIPKLVESEEEGLFIELVREIKKRSGQQFTIELLSPGRTLKNFEEGSIIGFFPGTENRVQQMKHVVTSIAFYVKRALIFTPKGVSLTSIEALEGKRVGLTSGYTYPEELISNPNITFLESDSDVINMKNLAKRRLDAFIVEEFSGLSAMEQCGCTTDISYDLTATLSSQNVYFVFQTTDKGRSMAEEFSKAVLEMKEDGSLQQILGVSQKWVDALPE